MTRESKTKNKDQAMLIAGIIVVAIVIVGFVIKTAMNVNSVKKQEEQKIYYEWLVDNCECTEHERIFCQEGFELSESKKICVAEGKFTNVLKGCSQYNCEEEIVNWNDENKLWSPVLEFEND